jgi:hypothetical protein
VRPGEPGAEISPALALLGGQVRNPRRVLLPLGMSVDLHHPARALDHYHRVEDAFGQPGDPHLGQPGPAGVDQVRGQLVGQRPGHLGRVEAAGQGDRLG